MTVEVTLKLEILFDDGTADPSKGDPLETRMLDAVEAAVTSELEHSDTVGTMAGIATIEFLGQSSRRRL